MQCKARGLVLLTSMLRLDEKDCKLICRVRDKIFDHAQNRPYQP